MTKCILPVKGATGGGEGELERRGGIRKGRKRKRYPEKRVGEKGGGERGAERGRNSEGWKLKGNPPLLSS